MGTHYPLEAVQARIADLPAKYQQRLDSSWRDWETAGKALCLHLSARNGPLRNRHTHFDIAHGIVFLVAVHRSNGKRHVLRASHNGFGSNKEGRLNSMCFSWWGAVCDLAASTPE